MKHFPLVRSCEYWYIHSFHLFTPITVSSFRCLVSLPPAIYSLDDPLPSISRSAEDLELSSAEEPGQLLPVPRRGDFSCLHLTCLPPLVLAGALRVEPDLVHRVLVLGPVVHMPLYDTKIGRGKVVRLALHVRTRRRRSRPLVPSCWAPLEVCDLRAHDLFVALRVSSNLRERILLLFLIGVWDDFKLRLCSRHLEELLS
mmetsp:Transcript_32542/g.103081  ORF Transcript_32542/g.103081 Transcript_32542/m.103081 type:complete len:200 (-) Transcript_32542:1440-2039(-)